MLKPLVSEFLAESYPVRLRRLVLVGSGNSLNYAEVNKSEIVGLCPILLLMTVHSFPW